MNNMKKRTSQKNLNKTKNKLSLYVWITYYSKIPKIFLNISDREFLDRLKSGIKRIVGFLFFIFYRERKKHGQLSDRARMSDIGFLSKFSGTPTGPLSRLTRGDFRIADSFSKRLRILKVP